MYSSRDTGQDDIKYLVHKDSTHFTLSPNLRILDIRDFRLSDIPVVDDKKPVRTKVLTDTDFHSEFSNPKIWNPIRILYVSSLSFFYDEFCR